MGLEESKPTKFLDFPREIRDIVYGYACNWNDAVSVWDRANATTRPASRAGIDSNSQAIQGQRPPTTSSGENWLEPRPQRSTPTALLLNRQITAESLKVLVRKPLQIKANYGSRVDGKRKIAFAHSLFDFISLETIQRVPYIEIVMEDDAKPWNNDGVFWIQGFLFQFRRPQGIIRRLRLYFVIIVSLNEEAIRRKNSGQRWLLAECFREGEDISDPKGAEITQFGRRTVLPQIDHNYRQYSALSLHAEMLRKIGCVTLITPDDDELVGHGISWKAEYELIPASLVDPWWSNRIRD